MVLGEGAGGKDVYVLSVREHKMGVNGAACLMLDASDWPQLEGYVEHVRPLLDPASPAPPWTAGQRSPPGEVPRSTLRFLSSYSNQSWKNRSDECG